MANPDEIVSTLASIERSLARVDLSPESRAELLGARGAALSDSYDHTGDCALLDASIEAFEAALSHDPKSPHGAAWSNDLGIVLLARYEAGDDASDLHRAVMSLDNARSEVSGNELVAVLNNLSNALSLRFARYGDIADLERALEHLQQSLSLEGLPPTTLAELEVNKAALLRDRYGAAGDIEDLRSACAILRSVAERPYLEESVAGGALANLAIALVDLHHATGASAVLDDAIEISRKASEVLSNLQQALVALNNLGAGLLFRFEKAGVMADLDEAIASLSLALAQTPQQAPGRAERLGNLGAGYNARYLSLGQETDLDLAIRAYREALQLPSPATPAALVSSGLATSLRERYLLHGVETDLSDAIAAFARSVELTPSDSPAIPGRLMNLGVAYRDRYDRHRRLSDLDQSIEALEKAARTMPNGSSEISLVKNNLGVCFRERYRCLEHAEDLDAAIESHSQAVEALEEGSPHYGTHVNNLGNSLRERFVARGERLDLDRATELLERSVELAQAGASVWAIRASNLATTLYYQARAEHKSTALYRSIDLHEQVLASTPAGSPALAGRQLALADALVELGDPADHGRIRSLYEMAFALGVEEDPLAALAAARAHGAWAASQDAWDEASSAFVRAVSAAEILHEGQDRVQHKEVWLRSAAGLAVDAASAFLEIGDPIAAVAMLEHGRARLLMEATSRSRERADWRAADPAKELRLHNHADPLVYLAVPTIRPGFALLVTADAGTRVVELPKLTAAELKRRVSAYFDAYNSRSGQPVAWLAAIEDLTRWLSEAVMGPLELAITAGQALSVVPCGLLGLLPLHAAWAPDNGGRRYWLDGTSLRYQANARTLSFPGNDTVGNVLVVADPGASGGELRRIAAGPEIAAAASLSGLTSLTILTGPEVTKTAVLSGLKEASVAHFACHSSANVRNPREGGLFLVDGERLTIGELASAPPFSARLVVLAACETHLIGTILPDEMVSLPSALRKLGVRAVIASMWAVPDRPTSILMEHFYQELGTIGASRSQDALRAAQIWFRIEAASGRLPSAWQHPYFWAGFASTGG